MNLLKKTENGSFYIIDVIFQIRNALDIHFHPLVGTKFNFISNMTHRY